MIVTTGWNVILLSNLEIDSDQTIPKAKQSIKHQMLFFKSKMLKIHQNPPSLLPKILSKPCGCEAQRGSSWGLGDSCTSAGIDFLNTVTQHVPPIRHIIHFTEGMQCVCRNLLLQMLQSLTPEAGGTKKPQTGTMLSSSFFKVH